MSEMGEEGGVGVIDDWAPTSLSTKGPHYTCSVHFADGHQF